MAVLPQTTPVLPLSKTPLTPPERRLVGLLALGQTPMQAAAALGLALEEAEALVATLLQRHGVATRHHLIARALVHRWI